MATTPAEPEHERRRLEVLGRRIRQLRLRKHWKIHHLAYNAHVAINTVRGLEAGTTRTQSTKLQAIAKALDTTADLLLDNLDNDTNLAWLYPQLRDLVAEDLCVANLYHRATPPTRDYVRHLLKIDQRISPDETPSDQAVVMQRRFALLSDGGRIAIDQVLRIVEQTEQEMRDAKQSVLPSAS